MDRETFAERLHAASTTARNFARSFILEKLPDEMLFRVRLNQSYDGNPLRLDECLYPEDTHLNLAEEFTRCKKEEVVDLLRRDDRVPEWIDIAVVAETGSATILELRCCGRFTADQRLLYHVKEGWPPFHALGPVLPPGYQNGERFSIYTRCEALKLADVEAVTPHSNKVWSLNLRGAAWDDQALRNLPRFPSMEVLDLTHTSTTSSGFADLDRQPKLRVLKIFAPHTQPLNLEKLPRLPLLKTLIVQNPLSLALDLGSQSPKFASLNHLDLQSSGVLSLNGPLPPCMWALRLAGKNISGALICCDKVEVLSLRFPDGNEDELRTLLRHAEGVKFLELSTTPVSDNLIRAWLNRWPLEYLEVSGTNVSEELVKELEQRRPNLRVFSRKNVSRTGPGPSPLSS